MMSRNSGWPRRGFRQAWLICRHFGRIFSRRPFCGWFQTRLSGFCTRPRALAFRILLGSGPWLRRTDASLVLTLLRCHGRIRLFATVRHWFRSPFFPLRTSRPGTATIPTRSRRWTCMRAWVHGPRGAGACLTRTTRIVLPSTGSRVSAFPIKPFSGLISLVRNPPCRRFTRRLAAAVSRSEAPKAGIVEEFCKASNHSLICWLGWSEWRDLNSRPLPPEDSALPS